MRLARHTSRVRRALAAGLLMSAACSGRSTADALPVLPIGGDFALTDHQHQRFELSSLRGKVVLVFFGYSFCPDFCPTTLSKLASVSRRLGDAQSQIKTLYITVDPERDTPEVLRDDLSNFRLDALGLTGTKAEIDTVVKLFGASYSIVPTPESAAKYTVSHSTTLYVLDRQGRVRIEFPYEATIDEILLGVNRLLAERP
jgi:protein SCO1